MLFMSFIIYVFNHNTKSIQYMIHTVDILEVFSFIPCVLMSSVRLSVCVGDYLVVIGGEVMTLHPVVLHRPLMGLPGNFPWTNGTCPSNHCTFKITKSDSFPTTLGILQACQDLMLASM